MTPYQHWCRAHMVDHGHCPLECESPQPIVYQGTLICGRCAAIEGVARSMVPCQPNACIE